ncbi:hypothetical protein [Chryseobacterium echinoideorum]|uniref:hypothetical protein n=1 Tax=Chryseobacterium echinoideorum TaxID=1549648 RepID=UPI001186F5FF|nr:hypothetical protein [Chryseobacterium echinoideorum]
MKKITAIMALSVFLIQCNKKNDTVNSIAKNDSLSMNTEAESEKEMDTLNAKTYCYIGVTGKDSVFVSIDDNLGTLSGKMSYKNFEKDSSKGELSGFKSGDTLKVTYEFASEGMNSKRDIFFIQKDNMLIEGIGNQKDDNGIMRYADENKIDYKSGQNLKSADCKIVTKALK